MIYAYPSLVDAVPQDGFLACGHRYNAIGSILPHLYRCPCFEDGRCVAHCRPGDSLNRTDWSGGGVDEAGTDRLDVLNGG